MSFADELQTRLYELALGVVRFCRTLPKTAEAREWAGQLRRASSGASANYRASRRGRSRNEWRAKLGTVVEELDEAEHWFSMIQDAELAEPPHNLITECRQLRAILAKSHATAARKARENKSKKGKKPKAPPHP